MLDTDTKRRIDTARDILVGKVPDPKSQVEQITIALIYKFMDDMDAEAEEMGGNRKFFAGDFARYGWAKLMRSGLGGHETLNLYAEAIAKMPENPGIPPLFRDIFKNAYLPYRDPETLKAFLKIIDEFSYDHSERLGDAFEYLLSVLGSQGDAGQFRTPRHIIDFMVEVLDPKKNETVLDPACGTAGFLISAYKHILAANRINMDKQDGQDQSCKSCPSMFQNSLTPEERGRLAENIKGYDISPDMVRLSLVNLYLHGFAAPHIYEYDTLTSEERWNDFADVILANPPFMSPKGGIKPHKRFSIQAKRSEVLFVDYMAEHLTPTGRAGIIVPEGIIFQSQDAYKSLRKMLVENSLVAVVSLPAGCFNPYSGVKTSILILDKTLAKRAQTIAFFKVENDGFGLGAQRREITKNDLPQVKVELDTYLQTLRRGQSVAELILTTGFVVPKEKLAANGDYNLSCERYRECEAKAHTFQIVKIGDICTTSSGGTPLSGHPAYYEKGTIPWLRSGEVSQGDVYKSEMFITDEGFKNSSAKMFAPNTVLVAMYGATAGEVGILRIKASTNQAICGITPDERLIPEFLYLVLKANKPALVRLAGGGAQPNISQKIIRDFPIPLPPLEIQKEIVAEIEGYQKIINGARAVLDNYRPHITIDPAWPMVKLEDVTETDCSLSYGIVQPGDELPGGLPIVRPVDLTTNMIRLDGLKRINPQAAEGYKRSTLQGGESLLCVRGTTGIASIAATELAGANVTRGIVPVRFNPSLMLPAFGFFAICSESVQIQIRSKTYGATLQQINIGDLRKITIPLPPIETQREIVAEIEAEQALVNANRELITRFETKIQTTLARVWGE